MSYRSLRIRAFQTSKHSTFLVQRWASTNPRSRHNDGTNAPFKPDDAEIAKGFRRIRNITTDSEGNVSASQAKHDVLHIQVENHEPTRALPHSELPITSTLPTFHPTSSRQGDCQALYLPTVPIGWGPTSNKAEISRLKRRMLLRSAFLEPASKRVPRRSHIKSRVIKSEKRLDSLSELQYPYQRLPPNWERNFFALFSFRQSTGPDNLPIPGIQISGFADEWLQELYDDGDVGKASERWRRLSLRQRGQRWPHIMLRCLTGSTEQALDFLIATHTEPCPPFEVVMDAMLYLKRARGHEIGSSVEMRGQYLHILSQQRQSTRWFHSMERRHLDLLLEDGSAEEGKRLFGNLLDAKIDLSYHCMLIFMDFFTKTGDVDLALQALNYMDPARRLQSDQHLLSRCTNLLKLDAITYDGASPNFLILPRILEAGVKPNIVLHNMIMKNAVNLGAPVVAWDLFRYLQDNDLPNDACTHLILMQDALTRRHATGLQELLTVIKGRKDLVENPHLMAYTLNVIRVIHGQELKLSPSAVFANMLAVYSLAFDAAPLRHLKMVGDNSRSLTSPSQVEPDAITLAYVVWAYVLAQEHSKIVRSLWNWVEHLRLAGDDTALALAQCLPFYDGFILFYARKSETLPECLRVVQSMLDRQVQPSATTWGILVVAFMKYGQFQAAEEVKNMMDRKGLRLREKTTRLVAELQSRADSAEAASGAVKEIEERPRGLPVIGKSPLEYAVQGSDPREDSVEAGGYLSSHDHHDQQMLPESEQLNSLDLIVDFGSSGAEIDCRKDVPQLEKQQSLSTTLGTHQTRLAKDQIDNPESSNIYDDAEVHDHIVSDLFQANDRPEAFKKKLDLSLLGHRVLAASNSLQVAEGSVHDANEIEDKASKQQKVKSKTVVRPSFFTSKAAQARYLDRHLASSNLPDPAFQSPRHYRYAEVGATPKPVWDDAAFSHVVSESPAHGEDKDEESRAPQPQSQIAMVRRSLPTDDPLNNRRGESKGAPTIVRYRRVR